ncbi:acetylornithine transaminase [Nocardioides jejuensis]|uniref:Acetylornithine aminotransferase n=1 Tax=Nocardioides jejuensis TaxID=2502782 RepID=A0A4R1BTZ7_9ACTN|nr:acetylornithine transaminase [Nocardioides jejuensis]TCJ21138.1 acetylornithine transaminase [Nocardioides jejuensis]
MTSQQDWTQRYTGAVMNTFGTPKLVLIKGQGARVWDADGKEYVDLLGGIAVNALGHAHPALVGAVTEQLQTLGHISNFFASAPQVELAERLCRMVEPSVGAADTKVFFTNSGAEANEAAFKLTRRTGRTHIVATEGAFHGRTMGALALTSKEAYRAPFEPLPGDVTFVPYGDAEALAAAVTDATAAVIIEPVQGEAGVIIPPADYLAQARHITTAHGALLWLDEIQTGIGRTGTWLAFQNDELCDELPAVPDIVTLAKGLAGGIPIGACVATGAAASLLQPGNHGSTFAGNPIAAAAALAVLDTIEKDGLLENVAAISARLTAGLSADARITEVRAAGLLIGVDLVEGLDSAAVVAAALDAGFIINNPTPSRLRFAPPLVLTEADVDAFLAALPAILDAAEGTVTA